MDAPTLPGDPSPAAAPVAPAYTHQQILKAVSGVLLCIFLSALDQTVVVPAVPAIAADLNGFGQLAWIVSAYLLTSTAAFIAQQRLAPDALLPPRLFARGEVVCGIMIGALGSAAMLGATFLLPLFFQLARGAGEASSGAQLVPLLVVSTMGAFIGGQLARRLGRVKRIMMTGLSLSTLGFLILATADRTTPTGLILAEIAMIGLGIGVCMPNSAVVVQNACERRDIGAATGAMLLLRSLGSAVGSTLVGAVLSIGFTLQLAGTPLAGKIDLGSMHGPRAIAIPPDAIASVADALAGGFHIAFVVLAAVTLCAVGVTALMKDLPLRS